MANNVWGTDRSLINADEFCVECEHAIGGHYTNCPTRIQTKPNGEFLNLCSDCIESTDTSAMEYCGLTMSLAPHCDKCGKSGGKFGYYKPSEVEQIEKLLEPDPWEQKVKKFYEETGVGDPAEFYRHGGGTTRGDGGF